MDLFSFYTKTFLLLGEVEAERNFGTNAFGHLFFWPGSDVVLRTAGICQIWDLSVLKITSSPVILWSNRIYNIMYSSSDLQRLLWRDYRRFCKYILLEEHNAICFLAQSPKNNWVGVQTSVKRQLLLVNPNGFEKSISFIIRGGLAF